MTVGEGPYCLDIIILLLYSSHLPLGVPNGLVIYQASSTFSGAINQQSALELVVVAELVGSGSIQLQVALIYGRGIHSPSPLSCSSADRGGRAGAWRGWLPPLLGATLLLLLFTLLASRGGEEQERGSSDAGGRRVSRGLFLNQMLPRGFWWRSSL
jgi:hypothetical protein